MIKAGSAATGSLFHPNNLVRSHPGVFAYLIQLIRSQQAATAAGNNKRYWSHKMKDLQVCEPQSFTVFLNDTSPLCDILWHSDILIFCIAGRWRCWSLCSRRMLNSVDEQTDRHKPNGSVTWGVCCHLHTTARCSSYSSNSYCWASVANAPNVLQPYWLIVLPLDVPALSTSLLLRDPSGQRWNYTGSFINIWTI
jgi:hypothetical protein